MIAVDKALEIVLAQTPFAGREEVLLPDALGRVLVDDVHVDVDLPPFDRAAMDGFAVRAADAVDAPVTLEVVGEVRAGRMSDITLQRGQAVAIMTGAPVPLGATAVQPIEKTRRIDTRHVEFQAPVTP